MVFSGKLEQVLTTADGKNRLCLAGLGVEIKDGEGITLMPEVSPFRSRV